MSGPELIHVVGAVFGLSLLYHSYRLTRRQRESPLEFLMWFGFGAGILVVSISQATSRWLLAFVKSVLFFLGFRIGSNGVFTLAIMGLLIVIFYTHVGAKTNERRIMDLNQEIALLRYEQENREASADANQSSDSD